MEIFFTNIGKTDFLATANRSIIDSIHKSCYTLQLSYPIKETFFFFQIRFLNFGSIKNNHIPYLIQKISGDKL